MAPVRVVLPAFVERRRSDRHPTCVFVRPVSVLVDVGLRLLRVGKTLPRMVPVHRGFSVLARAMTESLLLIRRLGPTKAAKEARRAHADAYPRLPVVRPVDVRYRLIHA